MYPKAYLEPSRTSMVEILGKNHKDSFILDTRLCSKYVFAIGFTVGKIYRTHYLSDIVKVDLKNLPLRSCFFN